jgi:hypothetical protein
MNHAQNYLEQQEAKRLQNRISSFLEDFKFGTLLSGSGIRKLRGTKPLAVFAAIFSLPFSGGQLLPGYRQQSGVGIRQGCRLRVLEESQV